MPAGRRPLSRRTTLVVGAAGAAGLVAVAGCDDDPGASGGAGATPTPADDQDGDPDGDLVAAVLDELSGAQRLAVAGGFPELAALHRAHIEALDGTPPTPATGHAGAGAVRRTEKRLQARLVESAMAAQSGTLARLLASMSAAVAQQLTRLPGSAG